MAEQNSGARAAKVPPVPGMGGHPTVGDQLIAADVEVSATSPGVPHGEQ